MRILNMFYTPFNSLHLKNNLQAHKINKEIGTHRNIPERNNRTGPGSIQSAHFQKHMLEHYHINYWPQLQNRDNHRYHHHSSLCSYYKNNPAGSQDYY